MSMVPYPARYRPSRATYCVLGASLGFCAAMAIVHAGTFHAGRGGLSEDVARQFRSRWFAPVKASGGELQLRATPHWVAADPAAQRQAAEEVYCEWRRHKASHWYCRVFIEDAGGVVVVALAGTPRGTTVEPPDFFG